MSSRRQHSHHDQPDSRQQQRRTILSEEEYSDTLSTIIQRDYFPDLVDLERQTALQQRRDAGDLAGAIAVRRAARQLQYHEEALVERERQEELGARAAAEERGEGNLDLGVRRRPRPIERESLTGFHARVTSEDNAGFEETQKQEIETLRQERERVDGLMLTAGSATSTQSRAIAAATTPFLLASDEFLPESNAPDYHSKNNKSESVEALKALMPPPFTVDRQQKIPKDALVEYIPKETGLQKKIEPAATRFPRQDIRRIVRHQTHLEGSDAGSTTDYSTDASTDLDTPVRPMEEERRKGLKRRRREQETLVQMTPLIVPGQQGNASPLVTWGAVSSTPVVLGQSQHNEVEPTNSFCMPERSAREKAAAMARSHLEERARKSRAAGTPVLDRNKVSLTPAARALLAKSNRSTTRPLSARSGGAFASVLRSSYSRTPNSSRSATSSAQQSRGIDRSTRAATPRIKSEPKKAPAIAQPLANPNVTDGLLQLPK